MGIYSLKKVMHFLDQVKFATDRERYLLGKLDKKYYMNLMNKLKTIENEFIEVISDKNELSLIIKEDTWKKYFQREFKLLDEVKPLAIITCETAIEQVTGFLFATMGILSPNNIGVYVQGAFTTDHIFVAYEDLDKALSLLNQLKQES